MKIPSACYIFDDKCVIDGAICRCIVLAKNIFYVYDVRPIRQGYGMGVGM